GERGEIGMNLVHGGPPEGARRSRRLDLQTSRTAAGRMPAAQKRNVGVRHWHCVSAALRVRRARCVFGSGRLLSGSPRAKINSPRAGGEDCGEIPMPRRTWPRHCAHEGDPRGPRYTSRMSTVPNLIANRAVTPDVSRPRPVVNPATGETLAQVEMESIRAAE